MLRLPVVADRFYPGDPGELESVVAGYTSAAQQKKHAKLVVVPHAGYVYSGGVAGETFSRVEIPRTVIMLGPNHHGHGARIAMSTQDWATPMGRVPCAVDLASLLGGPGSIIQTDDMAHRHEHSLEVQLPFLQFFQKQLSIVAITLSTLSWHQCQEVAREITEAIRSYSLPVLVVASTDMTHYESRDKASQKDKMALEHVIHIDPKGLYDTVVSRKISMCGVIPTTIALTAAIALGAQEVDLVRYTDSGEVTGETGQVVGYAGLVVT